MNRIDDPRLLFYLKHQELIDEWAAVKDDVRHAAIDFYESLADDLEEQAESIGGDVIVVRKHGGYGYVGLANPAWVGEEEARVAIVLEWQRSSASFISGWREVGVRVEPSVQGYQELSEAIRGRVHSTRGAAGFPSSNKIWPAHAAAPGAADPEYWTDLGSFRHELVSQVRAAWDAFSTDIDGAVQENPMHDVSSAEEDNTQEGT